jgi:hypothetical protein
MARTLTVSRVRVRPGAEQEYLSAVAELAALSEGRGRRLWVFRRSGDSALFLECNESRSADTHRALVELPSDERRLEERIRAIATYLPDAWDLWEEVRG